VSAKVTLILLVAFKRAMMLFLKDGVDRAVQELRAEESIASESSAVTTVTGVIASQGRSRRVPTGV
jgi:hypothetical protein